MNIIHSDLNMEKQINKQIEEYITTMKDDIRNKILELGLDQQHMSKTNELLEYIYDYSRLVVKKDEINKKKRGKPDIAPIKRCNAYRADNEQCTRRKKEGSEYCGTHVKGIPNGFIQKDECMPCLNTKIEVIAREIDGIVYYIDSLQNIYKTEDVMNNVENPRIIGICRKNNGMDYVYPK